MRILHVIPGIDGRSGGPTAALAGLAAAQIAAGIDVSLVATFGENEDIALADTLRRQGANVHLVGPTRGPLRRHPDLKRALAAAVATADAVHIHALWEEIQFQATLLAHRAQKPYVIRPCGMLTPWSLGQSRWRKRVYSAWRLNRTLRRAAALHFTTAEERDASDVAGSGAEKIIEPNGVDFSEFGALPPRGAFRAQHGIAADRLIVTYLGRIHDGKGLNLLIPAFAQARTNDALLVLAGPDSEGYQANVERWIAENNIQERVLFTGMLRGRQRIEALVDADLFVLPSYHENFGIALVEALAAGLPVITTDQVNIHRELAAAGVGAIIPTQMEPLRDRLSEFLQNPEARAACAARARPFALANYDWRQIAERWKGHYARLRGG